jgi:hypothetical protein
MPNPIGSTSPQLSTHNRVSGTHNGNASSRPPALVLSCRGVAGRLRVG